MDVNELLAYLVTPIAQVSLIMGLAELAKKLGLISKLVPVLDLVLGLLSGILVYGVVLQYGILQGALLGVAMGLSACGLFSGVKNVAELWRENAESVQ